MRKRQAVKEWTDPKRSRATGCWAQGVGGNSSQSQNLTYLIQTHALGARCCPGLASERCAHGEPRASHVMLAFAVHRTLRRFRPEGRGRTQASMDVDQEPCVPEARCFKPELPLSDSESRSVAQLTQLNSATYFTQTRPVLESSTMFCTLPSHWVAACACYTCGIRFYSLYEHTFVMSYAGVLASSRAMSGRRFLEPADDGGNQPVEATPLPVRQGEPRTCIVFHGRPTMS